MTYVKIEIKIFLQNIEQTENFANTLTSIFKDFSSYLTFSKGEKVPLINPSIEFSSDKIISECSTAAELVAKFNSTISADLLLIGLFKNLSTTNSAIDIQNSFIDDGTYIFINYEPQESLKTNETTFSTKILNEFVNQLFFLTDRQLETHSGECFRDLNKNSSSVTSVPITSSNFLVKQIKFCSNCSAKIKYSLDKLVGDNKHTEDSVSSVTTPVVKDEVNSQPIQPSNLVQQATHPPPRRSQVLADPNSDLTFDQRKQINAILKELNLLREPLEDPDYLETRKRFFEGKISDQVFIQILKRKSI